MTGQHDTITTSHTGDSMTKTTTLTPAEDANVTEAREAMERAEADLSTRREALESKASEVRQQSALVEQLQQQISRGDLEAAEAHPAQFERLQELSRGHQNLVRVVGYAQGAVESARQRLTLAEAVAGTAGLVSEEERDALAEEMTEAVTEVLRPYVKQAEESDRATYAAMDALKGAQAPGLTFIGSSINPQGFNYGGQRYGSSATHALEYMFDRIYRNVLEELQADRRAAAEAVAQAERERRERERVESVEFMARREDVQGN